MQLSDYKVGIAVFLVLLALLAVLNPQPPVLETHKPPEVAEKNYSIDGQAIVVKKTLSALGDGITYKNKGTQSVDFGVIDVIPPSLAQNSQEAVFSNAGTGKAKTGFFDNKEPPVLRHTSVTLGPGETFERKTESRKFSLFPISQKPLHIFSNATLTAEEKKALEPALRKASSLAEQMNGEEREVFEEKLNNAMLKAKAQGNSASETAKAIEQFADDVKKAKDEAQASPYASAGATVSPLPANATQFLDKLKQMNANVPKPSASPSPQATAAGFKFPELPEKIELEVSEDDPYDEAEFTASAIGDFGSALVRIESEDGSSMHLTATTAQTTPTQYDFTIDADFSDRDTDELGLFDFDEGHAQLIVFYSGLQAEPKTVPIIIKVNHVQVSVQDKTELQTKITREEFNSGLSQGEPAETAPASSACAQKGKALVSYAKKFSGLKYVWGGTSLTKGADCSGFVSSVFKNFGISLLRTARDQATQGIPVNRKDLIDGDLLFSYGQEKRLGPGRVGHVLIYSSEGPYAAGCNAIDESSGRGKVGYANICSAYYKKKYAGARRIISECIATAGKSSAGSSTAPSGGSGKLAGKTIAIEAGHGVSGNGCLSGSGSEAIYTQDVALKLKALVEKNGGKTVLTRDLDCSGGQEYNLKKRAEKANAAGADLAIDIHFDSVSGTKAFVYCTCSGYHKECAISCSNDAKSVKLANKVYSQMKELVGTSNSRMTGFNLYFLRYIKMPGMVVEVTGASDSRAATSTFRQKIAEKLYQAIVDYYA